MNKKIIVFMVLFLTFSTLSQSFNIGGWNFYLTNEFIYQYNEEASKSDQYIEALSLYASYNKWTFTLTGRMFNFYLRDSLNTLDETKYELYRKNLTYTDRYFYAQIGDFNAIFGRGLVLSVLENEDVFYDTVIEGADFGFDYKSFSGRVLGGFVYDDIDDQKWKLFGSEIMMNYFQDNFIGLHASYIEDDGTMNQFGRRIAYSMSLQGYSLFPGTVYYVEYGQLDYSDSFLPQGKGFYGNVTYNYSALTIMFEQKYYKNFDMELNNPPVADREDEAVQLIDSRGSRLYIEYSFFSPFFISIFGSAGRYTEFTYEGWHYYGGFNIDGISDRLDLSASYGIKDIAYEIKKFDVILGYRFTDRLGATAYYKDKKHGVTHEAFDEWDLQFEVSYSPYISLYFLQQYSNLGMTDRDKFYSGGIKVYPFTGASLDVSGGTIRVGETCAGGQCFFSPPFKGIKVNFLYTFF